MPHRLLGYLSSKGDKWETRSVIYQRLQSGNVPKESIPTTIWLQMR